MAHTINPRVVFHIRSGTFAGIPQIMGTVEDILKELGTETLPLEFPDVPLAPDGHHAVFALLKGNTKALHYVELLAPSKGHADTFDPAQQ